MDLHIKKRAPVGAIQRKERNHEIEEAEQETHEGQETAGDEAAVAEFLKDRSQIRSSKS